MHWICKCTCLDILTTIVSESAFLVDSILANLISNMVWCQTDMVESHNLPNDVTHLMTDVGLSKPFYFCDYKEKANRWLVGYLLYSSLLFGKTALFIVIENRILV